MSVKAERLHSFRAPERTTIDRVIAGIPEAISVAKLEAESMDRAKTPEGKFLLTYLLASQHVLHPIISHPESIPTELLTPTGGFEYNPQRTIDDIGSLIALQLARETTAIPNLWIRSEELGRWQPAKPNEDIWERSDRLAIVDPLDETSSIPKGTPTQSTGMAIFNRNGQLLTVGVISLVDHGMMFFEAGQQKASYINHEADHTHENALPDRPIRVATLTRRMHALRTLPLFSEGGAWHLDSIGGFALLSMARNEIDTMIDPIKGNPWYEYVLWGAAAEKLGFVVSDIEGNPIDMAAIMRTAIERNPDDQYRIKFVISRTPEIHRRVLSLLQSQNQHPQTKR